MLHYLKILPEYFHQVFCGNKTFEVRKDDRNYSVGDYLKLHEWKDNGRNGFYTGRYVLAEVTYILRESIYCVPGFCIMSIKVVE